MLGVLRPDASGIRRFFASLYRPKLLRRTFDVDVLQCPKCHGRLRVLAVITEREPVRQILAHLGLPTEAPPVARARDPTDDAVDAEPSDQLELQLA